MAFPWSFLAGLFKSSGHELIWKTGFDLSEGHHWTLTPLQFAHRANRSVDDAVNMGLHFILQHLDRPGTYVRILFVDFSSAFNTIIPVSESHSPSHRRQRQSPDHSHLSSNHPHLQLLISTPISTTRSLTLIVRSTVHYPEPYLTPWFLTCV